MQMMMKPKSGRNRAWLGLVAGTVLGGLTACSTSGPEVTGAAPAGDLSGASGGAGTGTTVPLLGRWTLVALEEQGQSQAAVPGGAFAAEFEGSGALAIQADCNVCRATYTAAADGTLAVKGPFPCTRAFCLSAPLDTRYVALLETSSTWRAFGSTLELRSATAILKFGR